MHEILIALLTLLILALVVALVRIEPETPALPSQKPREGETSAMPVQVRPPVPRR